ncbi:MAG: 23S rRNA (uracil(1939)-C(5))-methyltransferase RlmD [Pseudomonadales bacterium]|nr:23S rRNA (uracil(1939)-C(5))-methyltransferase RlmD [Pseudomonadales bacterium]
MSSRRRRRNRLPAEAITLDVSAMSHEGRGIGHIDGKVAFVDGALEGETVSALYVRNRSQFSELKVEEVVSPSASRVNPPCEFTPICGGCSLQHWDTDRQLDFKESVLLEHLQRTTNLAADSFQLLPQIKANTTHYRRKARLAVRKVVKKGGVLVGFREKYSSFITDMNDCQVLAQEFARLIQPLRDFLIGLKANSDIPQIEVAVGEKTRESMEELQVALVIRHLKALCEDDKELICEFAESENIDVYLQPAGIDSVFKLYPTESAERLHYFLPEFDLCVSFHPMDFTQVNAEINRSIVSRAVSMLNLTDEDVVLDLFCGLGNFTLPIAKHCQAVVGIEGSEEMVKRGQENAEHNGIDNAEFFAADLTANIDAKAWLKQPFTKILLDPPRSGALEIISQIAKLGANKILYISCNPATLARDAAELIARGYKLNSVGVMDMFPHTTHVESMAEFILESKEL